MHIMKAQVHIMKNSSSSNSPSDSIAAGQKRNYIWDNGKNVFRIMRYTWSGDVPHRFNIETGMDEFWLALDFVNFEGWCTEAFLKAEIKKYEEALVEVKTDQN